MIPLMPSPGNAKDHIDAPVMNCVNQDVRRCRFHEFSPFNVGLQGRAIVSAPH